LGVVAAAAAGKSPAAVAALPAALAIVDVVGTSAGLESHLLEHYYYYSATPASDVFDQKLRLDSAAKRNFQAVSVVEVFQVSNGPLLTIPAAFLHANVPSDAAGAATQALLWSDACALLVVAKNFDADVAPEPNDDEQRKDHHLMIDRGDFPKKKKQEQPRSTKWKCSIF